MNTLPTKRKKWDSNMLFYAFLIGPPFLVLFLLTAGPLAISLGIGFYDWNLAKPHNTSFIGLDNFINMVQDKKFWKAVWLTVYQVGVTVFGQIVIGMGIALLLYREFTGIKLLRSVYMIPMMTTPIVVGLVWRMLYSTDSGVFNYWLGKLGISPINWLGNPNWAMPSVIMTDWWMSTPFVAIILLAGLQGLSNEPIEAAYMDGATKWQTFIHVILPLMKPIIMLAILFRTMDAIRRFDTIYVMTSGGPGNATETLNLHAYFHAFNYLNVGYSSALSTVMLIGIFACSLFILRKIQKVDI
ncbi:carbohydrate ABC transporter permease [Cohnella faecalis]|uniref:Sugar ABC transporter permease n=1 Tax=Cohnella faecalis TaxID=2315694 RepID=A0A398CP74_9BACL|nr:sugar ABC transporter permease [Cohnella faecalis]RIE03109.1 sugar ABC transporter permease [Cohnella faecalis]